MLLAIKLFKMHMTLRLDLARPKRQSHSADSLLIIKRDPRLVLEEWRIREAAG